MGKKLINAAGYYISCSRCNKTIIIGEDYYIETQYDYFGFDEIREEHEYRYCSKCHKLEKLKE